MIQRLEFHISYSCRNNCVFCSEAKTLKNAQRRFVPLETVLRKLKHHRKLGFTHVTFTGGEPTLHPRVIDILRFSKGLGLKTFITTNGGLFARKTFCDDALPLIDEISFSVHGPDARTHNALTRNPSSFNRLSKALANAQRSRTNFAGFANIVLMPQNCSLVEETLMFIARFKKIKQVLISNLAPEGAALDNYTAFAIPLGVIQSAVPGIIRRAEKHGLTIRFFGVPLCALRGFETHSNDLHWSPRKTLELIPGPGGRTKETLSFKPVRNRVKPALCRPCAQKTLCAGIFKHSTKIFQNDAHPKPA